MARLQITYRDGTTETCQLGAFAQIGAKRRYGLEALQSDDPEPVLFGAFVELNGPAAAKADDAFEAWLWEVQGFALLPNLDDADADPPEADPSSSSPDSPPTSDSTPSE